MATFTHGKKIRVLVDSGEFSEFFKEMNTAFTMDTAETSSFGSEVKTYVQGLSSGTLSLSGMFDGTAGAVDSKLAAAIGAEDETIVTVAPTGSFDIGRRVVSGKAWEGSYQVSGSVGDIVGVSAEFTGTGGFRPGVSLHGLTAESASTTASAVQVPVSSNNGAILTLQAIANTRDGATDIKVEHSADGVTYATLATFTQIAAATTAAEYRVVAQDVTINRYTRVVSTLAGTTGSISYTVALVRL